MKKTVKKYWIMLIQLFHSKERIDFIIRLIVISLIFFCFFYFIKRYQKSKNYMDPYIKMSIYNEGSSGTQALKKFLEISKLKVDKILKPLIISKKIHYNKKSSQAPSFKGIILIIEPEKYFQKDDIETIELKAKEGATFMIFTENEYKIASFFEDLKKKKEKYKNGISWSGQTNKYFLSAPESETKIRYDRFKIFPDVKKIELTGKKRFKKWKKNWKIMVKDKYGPIALFKKVGKGKIILFSDSQFVSNYYIKKLDNGVFIYRLIKYFSNDGTVYFNEYYHGFHKRYTLLYFFARRDTFNIILQILLFFLFLFLAAGIKFGKFKEETNLEHERIYYFSEGMANLMARRKYHKDLFYMMVKNFKRKTHLTNNLFLKQKLNKIDKLTGSLKKDKVHNTDIKKLIKIIKADSLQLKRRKQ